MLCEKLVLISFVCFSMLSCSKGSKIGPETDAVSATAITASTSYAVGVSYSAGINPYSMVSINKNLAVVNSTGVSILNNNGGVFTLSSTTYPFPNSYAYLFLPLVYTPTIVAGDFNEDGLEDLVAAGAMIGDSGNFHNFLYLMKGKNDGTFTQPTPIIGGENTFNAVYNLIVDDFNGDSHLDLTMLQAAPGATLLTGNGDGTFATQLINISTVLTMWSTEDGVPSSDDVLARLAIAKGDFNKDGIPDLAILRKNCSSSGYQNGTSPLINEVLEIWEGNTTGQFTSSMYSASSPFPVPITTTKINCYNAPPGSLAVADLNNDSWLDIVVSSGLDSEIYVLMGSETGTLTATNINPVIATMTASVALFYYSNLAVFDVNGDGYQDIVSAGFLSSSLTDSTQNQNVFFFAGNGDGTFQPVSSLVLSSLNSPTSMVVQDLDNNNIPDLAFTDSGQSTYINGPSPVPGGVYVLMGQNSSSTGICIANSSYCSGNTPFCSNTGACSPCIANTDCSGNTPVCNTTTGACTVCKANPGLCIGNTPSCNYGTGACQACTSDSCPLGTTCSGTGACTSSQSNGGGGYGGGPGY